MGGFFGGYGSKSPPTPSNRQTPTETTSLKSPPALGQVANELKDGAVKISDNIVEINRENPSSYRIFKMISGILMVVSSVINFVWSVLDKDLKEVTLAVYTGFFGFGICLMEAKAFLLPESWKDRMHRLFKILDYTWGRGAFFIFASVLQLSQGDLVLDFISGFVAFLVGLLCLSTSYGTSVKLSKLSLTLSGSTIDLRHSLTSKFSTNGYVCRSQLRHFFAVQQISLSSHELEAVYDAFDLDKDGQLSVDEFCAWHDTMTAKSVNNTPPEMV